MIVLRMTTIIVYGRQRGHEFKEIIETLQWMDVQRDKVLLTFAFTLL